MINISLIRANYDCSSAYNDLPFDLPFETQKWRKIEQHVPYLEAYFAFRPKRVTVDLSNRGPEGPKKGLRNILMFPKNFLY